MDEEKLIVLVQQYKEIYDLSDANYHNQLRRSNIWDEIGKELNAKGEDCRKKWTQIRDNYRKALKTRITKSGQAATNFKSIRFERQLEFLKDFFGERKQVSNITNIEAEEENEENDDENREENIIRDEVLSDSSSSLLSNPTTSRKRSQNTSQESNRSVLKEYLNYKQNKIAKIDHLTKYFQALEETVRTFSPSRQIQAKIKLNNVINDMELENINLLTSEQQMPPQDHALQQPDFYSQSYLHSYNRTNAYHPIPPQTPLPYQSNLSSERPITAYHQTPAQTPPPHYQSPNLSDQTSTSTYYQTPAQTPPPHYQLLNLSDQTSTSTHHQSPAQTPPPQYQSLNPSDQASTSAHNQTHQET